MITAILVAAVGAVPTLLGVLLGNTLWPPTRRLNRLEKLATTRSALDSGSYAAGVLDDAIDALAERVRADSVRDPDEDTSTERTFLVELGLIGSALAIAMAGSTILIKAGVDSSLLATIVTLVLTISGVALSVLSSRSAMKAAKSVPRVRQTAPGVWVVDEPDDD